MLNRLKQLFTKNAEKPTACNGENVIPIIEALGGIDNIQQVDACLTRLRVILKAQQLLDKARLKKLGAVDVIEIRDQTQILFGRDSVKYRDEIRLLLNQ